MDEKKEFLAEVCGELRNHEKEKPTKNEFYKTIILQKVKKDNQPEIIEDSEDIEAIPYPDDLANEAYNGLIGEIIQDIEPYTEADSVALLMTFLTAIGNYIGKRIYTKVSADIHSTNLFTILIGDTAKARKGTSLGIVKEVFRRIDEEYIRTKCVEGLASGEGVVWQIRDQRQDYVKNKKTGEFKKEIIDYGVSDKRLLVTESEFASVLRKIQRDGNVLSPILRQAFDGDKIQTLSKNNPAIVTRPHVSIIGHITIEELKRYLEDVELFNGFANRFIWQCVRRSKKLPDSPIIPDEVLNKIVKKLVDVFGWTEKNPSIMYRDEEAKETWKTLYSMVSESEEGIIGYVTSRAEVQILRLSLIYAVLDKSSGITTSHLESALAVWQRSVQSVCFIFGGKTGDQIEDKIITALKNGAMTQTEIYRNVFQRHIPAEKIRNALQKLSAKDKILAEIKERPNGKGRPSIVWRLK
jgi:hypothetical protein